VIWIVLSQLFVMVILALAVASIVTTVSLTFLFQRVRDWADEKHPRLGSLLSCHYCLAHWVAFPLVLYYSPHRGIMYTQTETIPAPVSEWVATTVSLFVSWLAVVALSAILVRAITGMRGPE
jgi:uncharacterized oligopeptide transporter (OPT) family protein